MRNKCASFDTGENNGDRTYYLHNLCLVCFPFPRSRSRSLSRSFLFHSLFTARSASLHLRLVDSLWDTHVYAFLATYAIGKVFAWRAVAIDGLAYPCFTRVPWHTRHSIEFDGENSRDRYLPHLMGCLLFPRSCALLCLSCCVRSFLFNPPVYVFARASGFVCAHLCSFSCLTAVLAFPSVSLARPALAPR